MLIFASLLAVLPSRIAGANRYDDQIEALREQADQYQIQANTLHSQATSLQTALHTLEAEKNVVRTQLSSSQIKYEKLTNDIVLTESRLKDNRDALGTIMADLYVESSISPLEMLASSKNIGDYIDKGTYRSAMRDQLDTTIASIKRLKEKVKKDQKEASKALSRQKSQRAILAAKEAEKKRLLDETQGSEASYRQRIADTKTQMAAVAEEERKALSQATNNGANNFGSIGAFQFRNFSGNRGCGGGYPYCGPQDSSPDRWDLLNRECVSYTAWAAYTRFGKDVPNFSGAGNAYQWPSTAARLGGAFTDRTPEVGSVAILPPTPGFSPIGHSMMVESILPSGWIHVSQYNFGGTGEYSTMDIASSGVVFVHFRNR